MNLSRFHKAEPRCRTQNFDFSEFFGYFDANKCRWEIESDSCDDPINANLDTGSDTDSDDDTTSATTTLITTTDENDTNVSTTDVTTTDVTITGVITTAVTTVGVTSTDVTTTAVTTADATVQDVITTESVSTDATTTDVTSTVISTTEIPHYKNQECEPLDDTWMCSSGSKNHSLCIKFCTEGSDFLPMPCLYLPEVGKSPSQANCCI